MITMHFAGPITFTGPETFALYSLMAAALAAGTLILTWLMYLIRVFVLKRSADTLLKFNAVLTALAIVLGSTGWLILAFSS
jgi:hypothetical protein